MENSLFGLSNGDTEQQKREQLYREAERQTIIADSQLSQWKSSQNFGSTYDDISKRLSRIRQTLGLDGSPSMHTAFVSPGDFNFSIQSKSNQQYERENQGRYYPNEFDNTFGQNDQAGLVQMSMEEGKSNTTSVSEQIDKLLFNMSNKTLEFDHNQINKPQPKNQPVQEDEQLLSDDIQMNSNSRSSIVGNESERINQLFNQIFTDQNVQQQFRQESNQITRQENVRNFQINTNSVNKDRVYSSNGVNTVHDQCEQLISQREERIRQLEHDLMACEQRVNNSDDLENQINQTNQFYKNQLAEFQKVIEELNRELQIKTNEGQSLRHEISSLNSQYYLREQEYQNEIELFQIQISQFKNIKDIMTNKNTTDQDLQNYIFQLESDLTMTQSQLNQLIREKSEFDAQKQDIDNHLKNISVKIAQDIEERYYSQVKDLKFVCQSLKRENQMLLSFKELSKKNSYRPLNRIANSNSGGHQGQKKTLVNALSEDITNIQIDQELAFLNEKINNLQNENYKLCEKIEWQDFQLRNTFNNSKQFGREQTKSSQYIPDLPVYQRRQQTLRESVIFWKDKSFKLANNFVKIISQLQEEVETMRRDLLFKENQLFIECQTFIKQILQAASNENQQLQLNIAKLEEQFYDDQSQIAELRAKIKENTIKKEFENDINQINQKTKLFTQEKEQQNGQSDLISRFKQKQQGITKTKSIKESNSLHYINQKNI